MSIQSHLITTLRATGFWCIYKVRSFNLAHIAHCNHQGSSFLPVWSHTLWFTHFIADRTTGQGNDLALFILIASRERERAKDAKLQTWIISDWLNWMNFCINTTNALAIQGTGWTGSKNHNPLPKTVRLLAVRHPQKATEYLQRWHHWQENVHRWYKTLKVGGTSSEVKLSPIF